MGKFKFLIALLILTIFISCGRIDYKKSLELPKDMPIAIEITVDISSTDDPYLFILAKEFEVNRDKKELTIKGEAFVTSVKSLTRREYSYAIKIENAKFSLPLGGKITITKDGKTEVLEQY